MAAFCALASAAPLGTPRLSDTPITLAAAPLFEIPVDPGLYSVPLRTSELLLPGLPPDNLLSPDETYSEKALVMIVGCAVSVGIALAISSLTALRRIDSTPTTHRQGRSTRIRRDRRTMAFI